MDKWIHRIFIFLVVWEDIMNYYLSGWKKYAVFSGRSRRREYWTFGLVNAAIIFILGLIGGVFTGSFMENLNILPMIPYMIFVLAVLIPSIAMTVRRLHDTNRSGAWYLLVFVPFGQIVILVFTLMDGTVGENNYGADPKGR